LPEVVSHHPRFNSLARCHAFIPSPRDVRLGTRVYYLRITSKPAAAMRASTALLKMGLLSRSRFSLVA
jgi:hypothetical protein